MSIQEFVIMESLHHWRTFALIDAATAVTYNMAYMKDNEDYGLLLIRRENYSEPVPWKGKPGVFTMLANKNNQIIRCNAQFRVKPTEPRMTVAELTKFICDIRMHDYTFADVPGSVDDVAGCRYWHICLMIELEEAGRVPPGTAEAFVRFIKERSDKLKERADKEPNEQLMWPTVQGIFFTPRLEKLMAKVEALEAKAEKGLM